MLALVTEHDFICVEVDHEQLEDVNVDGLERHYDKVFLRWVDFTVVLIHFARGLKLVGWTAIIAILGLN